ncbi:protein kinase [Novymonas esmeraldas]|uniref:non-specific serine/threonine protein kinase n=1 Tax=Novymonas esmeraldas TaxID=1808958 RepID=A0AAW0F0X7_9TRYP
MGGGASKNAVTVRRHGSTEADSTFVLAKGDTDRGAAAAMSGSKASAAAAAAAAAASAAGAGASAPAPGREGAAAAAGANAAASAAAPATTAAAEAAKTAPGSARAATAAASGSPLHGSGADGGNRSSNATAEENASPIPIRNGGSHVGYIRLSDIIGGKDSLSKYIKIGSIGKGAYGEAYVVKRNASYDPASLPEAEAQIQSNALAHATQPNGLYVAKIMDLRAMVSQDRQYAQTEIMCLAHTNHFAVIRYYEHYVLDSDDETVVIVTELADHGDLRRNLYNAATVRPFLEAGPHAADAGASGGRILWTEREAGTYFVQLLLALHHVHARRMIHRDIKSANLLLTSRGFLKLGDFGFSQKYESTVSSETIAGTFLGTPYYLSPEMWKGKRYGKKADIWAAGVVLYEMLMGGRRPFEAGGLPELRSCVVEQEFVPPVGPPATGKPDPQSKDAGSTKFSKDMQELLVAVFQKSPEKRPSAEELLHKPVMQHYLFVFEKHVQSLIASDTAALAADPATDRQRLYFPDPADQVLVLQGIAEGKEVIAQVSKRTISESAAPRYEGAVYKDNNNGIWKERYLLLDGTMLTISLSKGKEAVSGGERSKRVPLSSIKSVSPCEVEDAHVRVATAIAPAEGYKPPYAFAIAMISSNSIVFGVASADELDRWMQALMRALQID